MSNERIEQTLDGLTTCRNDLSRPLGDETVVFGFDGYIDTLRTVVAEREDHATYDRLSTLGAFGSRIQQSADAGSSLSMEWLTETKSTGGHACHLSRAFGTLGYEPVMIGMFGQPPRERFLEEFGAYELHSVGDPGLTDAVEFDDGKLMLIERGAAFSLDWEQITTEVGVDTLVDCLEGASLLSVGYLADITRLYEVIDGLRTEVWPHLEDPPTNVLVDPGDLRTLEDEQIAAGLRSIQRLDEHVDVTLSANRYETEVLAGHLGVEAQTLSTTVSDIRATLEITRVVSHTAEQSALATASTVASARVPRVDEPVKTTSAGDHFNVGLSLALLDGFDGAPAVTLGNAVASWFVRTGTQPTRDDLDEQFSWYAKKL